MHAIPQTISARSLSKVRFVRILHMLKRTVKFQFYELFES